MLRQVLPPLVAAYGIFVTMVVHAWRRPVPRPRGPHRRSNPRGLRGVARTIVGGYAAFLVIVLIFHVWLAEETDAFPDAVWGGAFLSGIAGVMALGASLFGRRSRRRG